MAEEFSRFQAPSNRLTSFFLSLPGQAMRKFASGHGASRDALVYMIGRGLTGVAGFWSIPLLVRMLGTSVYGRYSMMVFETIVFPQVTAGWLQQATLRYRQEWLARGESDVFLATQQRFALPVAGITAVLTGGCAILVHGAAPGVAMAVAAIAGLGALQIIMLATVQADLRPVRVVLAEFFRVAVPLVILVPLSFRHGIGLLSALGITAAGWAGSLVVLAQALPKANQSRLDSRLAEKMLRFGLPMAVWFFLNSGQIYVGRLLLARYADPQWVGIYSAFQDMSIKLGTVSLMPIVYSVHANGMALVGRGDLSAARQLIRRSYWVVVVIIACVTLTWLMVPGPIARMVIGSRDAVLAAQHRWVGATIILSTMLGSFGLLAHKGLEFLGRTGTMVGLAFMAFVLGAGAAWSGVRIQAAPACAAGLLLGNLAYIVACQVADAYGRRGIK